MKIPVISDYKRGLLGFEYLADKLHSEAASGKFNDELYIEYQEKIAELLNIGEGILGKEDVYRDLDRIIENVKQKYPNINPQFFEKTLLIKFEDISVKPESRFKTAWKPIDLVMRIFLYLMIPMLLFKWPTDPLTTIKIGIPVIAGLVAGRIYLWLEKRKRRKNRMILL